MRKKQPFIAFLLVVADFVLVLGSFVVAYYLRDYINDASLIAFDEFIVFAIIASVLYVLIFSYFKLYSISSSVDLLQSLLLVVIGGVTATMLSGAGIYFGKQFDYSRLIVGLGLVLSILAVWGLRIFMHFLELYLYAKGRYLSRILIVGGGEETTQMAISAYKSERKNGYELVGIVLMADSGVYEIDRVPVLGFLPEADFKEMIKLYAVDEIVLSDSVPNDTLLSIVNTCEATGVELKFVPDMYNAATARVETEVIAGLPVITLKPTSLEGWMVVVKRVIDITGAVAGLLVTSPILLVTAIAIKLDSKGPIFFIHKRVGQYGGEFGLIKFRSMRMLEKDGKLLHSQNDTEVEKMKEAQENYKLKHDPRITKVGHFIRKTSIDELPQLINVIRGELSLVGPRAYVRKELDTQQERFPDTESLVRRLLTVKPGVTGLWQISGRSNVSFTERVAMDAYYATNTSIWLDLKIILQTVPIVLKGSGAM